MNETAERNFQLTELGQALKVSRQTQGHFYRGTTRVFRTLRPSVFREDIYNLIRNPVDEDGVPYTETHFLQYFRQKAPAVHDSLPGDDDYLAWLLLMQQHGTPTRLLDWTLNILTAVYFAVRDPDDDKKDAELWCMNPNACAKASGLPAIPSYTSQYVQEFASQVICLQDRASRREMFWPLPFYPRMSLRRMVVQSSVYTIHPCPTETNQIPAMLGANDLRRYTIPAENKEAIRQELFNLNIDELTLFPDLVGLSRSLLQEANRR